jgi:hypothetical protein
MSSMISIASGEVIIFMMGILDLLTGVLIITSFYIPWFWVIPVGKGLISLVMGLASS